MAEHGLQFGQGAEATDACQHGPDPRSVFFHTSARHWVITVPGGLAERRMRSGIGMNGSGPGSIQSIAAPAPRTVPTASKATTTRPDHGPQGAQNWASPLVCNRSTTGMQQPAAGAQKTAAAGQIGPRRNKGLTPAQPRQFAPERITRSRISTRKTL